MHEQEMRERQTDEFIVFKSSMAFRENSNQPCPESYSIGQFTDTFGDVIPVYVVRILDVDSLLAFLQRNGRCVFHSNLREFGSELMDAPDIMEKWPAIEIYDTYRE